MVTTLEEPRKQSLFDIGDDLMALEALINEIDGDISDPTVEATITAWFAEIAQGNQGRKLDNYINLLRYWEMYQAAAKEESERCTKKARVFENRIVRLKERLKDYMLVTHQTKLDTATGRTVSLQNNGGVVPMIVAPDVHPDQLDERFQKHTITLDNTAVRKALEAGEALSFAQLGQRGTSLRIR